MAGNVRKIYIDSPVFTHEDEEHFHYVNTEVEGMTTRWSEEDEELQTLINNSVNPSVSAGHGKCQPDTQKAADQPHQQVRNSMSRDSLEDDCSGSDAMSKNKNSIVVANPSRYEDLTMRDGSHHADKNPATRNDRPDVVPKRVNTDAEPRHYYLHDDTEEYEETQLQRQNQRLRARRAHVPHLELSHSDDEPSDAAAALALEVNDGQNLQKNANHGKPRHVNFGYLPHNSNSANGSQLTDSLEVDEYDAENGGDGENPDYARSSYAGYQVHSKNEPNDAHSYLSVHRNVQTGQHGQYYEVPVHDENYQAHAPMQSFTNKRQQLSNRPPPPSSEAQIPRFSANSQSSRTTSDTRNRSDDGSGATDFVEANRHNVNKKPQRSYGQIYSKKKGKENTTDSDRFFQDGPMDSLASASSAGREKADPSQALSEQNSLSSNRENEELNAASAEQLWKTRSRSLAARKESAESLSGKNRRSKAPLPPKKVTRDMRTNDARPVVPQTTTSTPYEHRSSIQQFSAGSFTVPVQSEIRGSPPQKVSVDINLNVVSPRPLLNQPSTSLPIHYTSSASQDVYQYSSRTQSHTNATGQYCYPETSVLPTSNVSQPFTVPSQPHSGNTIHYTSGIPSSPSYTVLPYSTPQFVSSSRQQPMAHFVDSRGQVIPHQAVPQHLPIRYNYSYSQPAAVPVSDAPQHEVHPYQMQVSSVKCSPVGMFCCGCVKFSKYFVCIFSVSSPTNHTFL